MNLLSAQNELEHSWIDRAAPTLTGSYGAIATSANSNEFDATLVELAFHDNQQDAELVVISDDEDVLALAQSPIPLPPQIPEWLTPLVGILPAQLFACHLTTVKGFDTDKPRTIKKITETH